MKYFFSHLGEVESKLRGRQALLMVDFDGTLSPLASTPAQAVLPKIIKQQLKKTARSMPVVVVSGRSLVDIKNKVNLKDIIYAGNHGMEWQVQKKYRSVSIPKQALKTLESAKRELKKLQHKYPGALLEDKRIALALHYRNLQESELMEFKREALKAIRQVASKQALALIRGKKVLEVRPRADWDKGKFVTMIKRYLEAKLRKKFVPIYVGDDATDEDVFSVLKSGASIKVGKSQSSAKYYLNGVNDVGLLLRWLNSRLPTKY